MGKTDSLEGMPEAEVLPTSAVLMDAMIVEKQIFLPAQEEVPVLVRDPEEVF